MVRGIEAFEGGIESCVRRTAIAAIDVIKERCYAKGSAANSNRLLFRLISKITIDCVLITLYIEDCA